MELKEFCACMEQIAPRTLALDFDNVGLLVEPDHTKIKKVLLALDCTTVTAKEAIDLGADLLVTHHPQFFHGVKSIGYSSPITGAAAAPAAWRGPLCRPYQFGRRPRRGERHPRAAAGPS